MFQDLRFAVRTAVRTPSVAILAVLAFALGIGVTTAVFSIFNSVLLAPLPFPDPDQLVMVYGTQPACATCPASFPKYHDWKTRNQVFSAMGGSTPGVLRPDGTRDRRAGQRALHDRVARTTSSASSRISGAGIPRMKISSGGPKVVVLANKFWLRRFSGDPSVVGRTPDVRRRALRSDRRHAGDVHASRTATSTCRSSASWTRPRAATTFSRPTRA